MYTTYTRSEYNVSEAHTTITVHGRIDVSHDAEIQTLGRNSLYMTDCMRCYFTDSSELWSLVTISVEVKRNETSNEMQNTKKRPQQKHYNSHKYCIEFSWNAVLKLTSFGSSLVVTVSVIFSNIHHHFDDKKGIFKIPQYISVQHVCTFYFVLAIGWNARNYFSLVLFYV